MRIEILFLALIALCTPILFYCRFSGSASGLRPGDIEKILEAVESVAARREAAARFAEPRRVAAGAAAAPAAPAAPVAPAVVPAPAARRGVVRAPAAALAAAVAPPASRVAAAPPAPLPAPPLAAPGGAASGSGIQLEADEMPWFDLSVTNPALPAKVPAGLLPLSTLPYPPGIPSLAAYDYAVASPTYKAMERFSAAFITVNANLVSQYQWHRDPLHAWSRKYEYVWHAEALRALLPPEHAAAVATTWPDAAAPPGLPLFTVLDAGSGFTFFDQYVGSRLGVSVAALDFETSYIKFFGGLATDLLPGESPVPPIPYLQATIEETKLPDASVDAITCVSVLEHVDGPNLQITVREFKRILKPGGRLVLTFDTGQPPIAKNAAQSKELLSALRQHLVEDVTHGAPAQLLPGGSPDASRLFQNRKATPPEFGETLFSISAHVFIKPLW